MSLVDMAIKMVDEGRIDFDPIRTPYGWQCKASKSKARYIILPFGRRSGKTYWAGGEVVERGWRVKGDYMVVVPQYSQGDMTWKYSQLVLRKHWNDIVFNCKPGDRVIEFKNGTHVEWFSADNPASLRSYGPHGVVFDEFDHIQKQLETWEVMRPALGDYKAWCIFISSPNGKGGLFYRFWRKGMDKEDPEWLSFGYRAGEPYDHLTRIPPKLQRFADLAITYDRGLPSFVNPHLPEGECESMAEEMTELMVLQEIFACFIDEVGQAIRVPPELVGACEWKDNPDEDKLYVMGGDLGKHEDYTVIFVMDYQGNLVWGDRWRHIDWLTSAEKIKSIQEQWNNAPMLIDATGVGDAVFDYLVSAGVNVQPYKISTGAAKNNIIVALDQSMSNREIKLPSRDHKVIDTLLHELEIFTYTITEMGNIRYGAPEREHDDTVIALALTVFMLKNSISVQGLNKIWDDKWNQVF